MKDRKITSTGDDMHMLYIETHFKNSISILMGNLQEKFNLEIIKFVFLKLLMAL